MFDFLYCCFCFRYIVQFSRCNFFIAFLRKNCSSVDFIRKSTKVQSSRSSFERILLSIYFALKVQWVVGLRGLEPPTLRLSGVRSNHLSYKPLCFGRQSSNSWLPSPYGGDEENRTPDPLLARQVLSQLSYTPISSTLTSCHPFPASRKTQILGGVSSPNSIRFAGFEFGFLGLGK